MKVCIMSYQQDTFYINTAKLSNHSPLSRNTAYIFHSVGFWMTIKMNSLSGKNYKWYIICFHILKIKTVSKRKVCYTCFSISKRVFSLPGATIISCFLERIRRNVRSLVGSRSRTTLLALSDSWLINPAYWTVVVLSIVVLIGIPVRK